MTKADVAVLISILCLSLLFLLLSFSCGGGGGSLGINVVGRLSAVASAKLDVVAVALFCKTIVCAPGGGLVGMNSSRARDSADS